MIVTALGTGYLPIAPGTWSSALVCTIFLGVYLLCGSCALCPDVFLIVLVVVSSIFCIVLGDFTERTYGRKDPSQCTIDEVAGQSVALLALPVGTTLPGGLAMGDTIPHTASLIVAIGVSFLAFRAFDILKPPPARQLERVKSGTGVLLDDLVAGVYANAICQLLLRLALGWG